MPSSLTVSSRLIDTSSLARRLARNAVTGDSAILHSVGAPMLLCLLQLERFAADPTNGCV